MRLDDGTQQQRMKELVAEIETEQDQSKFMALVEELNRLLDADQQKQHDHVPDARTPLTDS